MPDTSPRTLTFPELVEARRATEIISQYLHEQLVGYLETLRPLLEPERVLGRFAGAKTVAHSAEKALEAIKAAYPAFTSRPVSLARDFDPAWLTEIDNTLELHRWEYAHDARSGAEAKAIMITHPAKWVLTYKSGCSLAQFAHTIGTREERRADTIRKFVINALVLRQAVERAPGLTRLFAALRYNLSIEDSPTHGNLPLVTITSALPSYRPADDLILSATAFSGVSAFNELIDLAAVETLEDPLKLAIQSKLNP